MAVTIVNGNGGENPSTAVEIAVIHVLTGAVAGAIVMFSVGFLTTRFGKEAAEAEAWLIRMRATAGPPNRRPRSRNASTVDLAGSRSSATAAKPAPASRSMPSAGRATRRYGNSKRR